jgi:hypothetical protein
MNGKPKVFFGGGGDPKSKDSLWGDNTGALKIARFNGAVIGISKESTCFLGMKNEGCCMSRQMVYQKIIFYAALVLSSIAFMHALGFATDIYSLIYHADSSSSMLYVEGAELYYQIQPFNKSLLLYVAILFGLCIMMFATLTHRRRLYYPTNYITTIAFSGYAAFYGATILVNALFIKQKYLAIDFERVKEVTDLLNLRFVKSTFMLDAGIALSIAIYLLIGGLIVNLIWKSVNMAREKRQTRRSGL